MKKVSNQNGGKPNFSGTNSSSELRTKVAFSLRSIPKFSSGTSTTCIPAFLAAATPVGASSKTRH